MASPAAAANSAPQRLRKSRTRQVTAWTIDATSVPKRSCKMGGTRLELVTPSLSIKTGFSQVRNAQQFATARHFACTPACTKMRIFKESLPLGQRFRPRSRRPSWRLSHLAASVRPSGFGGYFLLRHFCVRSAIHEEGSVKTRARRARDFPAIHSASSAGSGAP
jgi:hypothetical protein